MRQVGNPAAIAVAGQVKCGIPSNTVSPSTLPSVATVEDPVTQKVEVIRHTGDTRSESNRRTAMVKGSTENLEWERYHPSTPRHGNQDRCLNHKMRSSVKGSQDRRTMVPSGMRSAHQCVRTDSSPVSSADICKGRPQHTKTHPSKNGQCLSTDICLPDGRSPFPRPDESGLYTLGLVTAAGNPCRHPSYQDSTM